MTTEIIKIDRQNPDREKIQHAADILKDGGLVIFPTETVYGIGANMLKKETIARLYAVKQRPKDKPFSIHIDNLQQVEEFAADIPAVAYRLMRRFWPGPLTLILKGKEQQTVGLRYPDEEIALEIMRLAGVPVVMPSANLSGNPAPVDFQQAIKDLKGKVELAIDAGRTKLAKESTIVDASSLPTKIIRQGAISQEAVEEITQKKVLLFICTGNSCRSVMAKFLLEKRLQDMQRKDIEVLSRGVMSLTGLAPTKEVMQLLKEEGIDASRHISQKIDIDILKEADMILVMESLHEDEIKKLFPQALQKVFLLKEFTKLGGEDLNIYDPIGKPFEEYRQTFLVIKQAVERLVQII